MDSQYFNVSDRRPRVPWAGAGLFFSVGFRPFFLAAGAWSAIALAVWVCMLNGAFILPTRFTPIAWHIHEMLFGFVMATVAGFLLTAIPNWTGRPPVRGWTLGLLAGFWSLGRVACLLSGLGPAWWSIAADMTFPAALLVVVAREVVAARNWRNLPIVLPVALFGIANLLMHLEAASIAVPPDLGWRLGLAAPLILISAIGGRIVPAFTRNWLAGRGNRLALRIPTGHGWVDRAALGVLHAGLIAWTFFPAAGPLGYLLIAGGALNFLRLARWQGAASAAEPLLLILHVGYGWLALGVALLGVSLLVPAVPLPAAIHALTAGAIATMTLAVMTRATLGHTGRSLMASRSTVVIYMLITLAALTRIGAAWVSAAFMPLLVWSALCWIAAFGLFSVVYGRMLLTPRLERGAT